ncbi:hypothetical protein AD935_13900 [Gluconobacter japonicus]|nr:hypothetical protein AD935_13900 [Gluconobacter japonicus]
MDRHPFSILVLSDDIASAQVTSLLLCRAMSRRLLDPAPARAHASATELKPVFSKATAEWVSHSTCRSAMSCALIQTSSTPKIFARAEMAGSPFLKTGAASLANE